MAEAATETGKPERRRVDRVPLCRAAQLRPNGWSRFEVQLVDLSPRGFRARCDALLKVGNYVAIEIPGIGSVDARVIWRKLGEIGAQFVHPVDLAHCAWTAEPPAEVPEELARALARRLGAEG